MEYCEGGDLGALVRRCKRDGSRVSEDFVWQVRTSFAGAVSVRAHDSMAHTGGCAFAASNAPA